MSSRILWVISALIIISNSVAYAGTYWVDDNGAAAWGSCTGASPLSGASACSLATANSNASAGDVINMRTGTYSTTILPSSSGTSGNYITYQNYNSEVVTITTSGDGATLSNKSYIKIDGLRFTNTGSEWVDFEPNGSYNLIQNCHMEEAGAYAGLNIEDGADHNIILNNVFIGYVGPADTIQIWSSGYNLIDGNEFYYAPHESISLQDRVPGTTGYNVIRNNYIQNPWHSNFAVSAVEYIIIENNISVDAGDDYLNAPSPLNGGRVEAKGMQLMAKYGIVRNNILVNNGYGIGLASDASSTTYPWKSNCEYNRIYNNTLQGNVVGIRQNSADDAAKWNYIKNNIIRNNTDYNVKEAPQDKEVNYYINNDNVGAANYYSALSTVQDTLSVNPLFTDEDNRDFTLTSSSTMIDAGAWLTTTTSSGNGTQIQVADARYFTNGWGIISGDEIQLQNQVVTATVTAVNYDTNVVTVDTSLTWSSGQGVALAYSGTKPDIGAEEYSSTPPASDPTVTITGPTSSSSYNTTTGIITLSGTATSSDSTIASLSGSCPTCTPSTFTVSCDNGCDSNSEAWTSEASIALSAGNNVLTVTATEADSGTGNDVITVNQGQEGHIEAESATESSPMTEGVDGAITYIYSPTANSGSTVVNFSVSTEGDYKFIAHVYAPSGSENSMYFEVDSEGQQTNHFDVLDPVGWAEDELRHLLVSDPYVVHLTAGAHTLTFTAREANMRIDYFYPALIPNPQSNPTATITLPTVQGAITYSTGAAITVYGTSTDSDGTISSGTYSITCNGEIYDSGSITCDDGTCNSASEPWHVNIGELPVGSCAFMVYTTDNGTNNSDADILTFTMNELHPVSGAVINGGSW